MVEAELEMIVDGGVKHKLMEEASESRIELVSWISWLEASIMLTVSE